MKTALQLLKVAVPVSYQLNGLSVGIAPVLQYGTLEMSHMAQTGFAGVAPNAGPTYALLDNGKSSDTSIGYEVGVAYDFKDLGVEGLTLGAVYKSELGMTYDNTISASLAAFNADSAITSGDNLDQPAEIGVGVAYAFGESTIALDYKNVAWGDAAGYSDFGWEDQDIYSIGYEYATSGWAVRVGYNYAESPIVEQAGDVSNYIGAVKNFFNQAGFPGIVESHFTIGGSYSVNEDLELDLAVVYADEVTNSFDTTGMTAAFIYGGAIANGMTVAQAQGASAAAPASSIETTHSQLGVTIGASYKF